MLALGPTGPSFGWRINLSFDLPVSAKLYSATGPVVRTLLPQITIIFFLLLNFKQKRRKKMENNKMLVDGRYMVNLEVFDEIEKLDADGVVRVYKKCKCIEEGLLG